MFRSARWRSEKNKIKTVFKLQFHATQVSQWRADALTVSIVPGDAVKPTSRLEKSSISDGSCKWESPVYETVKFTRDPKSGKISARIYHFIVTTGAAKSVFMGEVSIDFADYAEITKTSPISLPLKGSSSNAILHVSIQRLQENVDPSEAEENEDAKVEVQDRSLRSQFSNSDRDESTKSDSTEDLPLHKAIHNVESNGNFSGSSGSDITMSSSESSSGLNTPRESTARENNVIQRDPNSLLSSLSTMSLPQKPTMDGTMVVYEEHQRSQWEWRDNFDTHEKERSEIVPEEIERLKSELSALARQANISELELQTLRKQIVKESRRNQDLLREVACLKDENNTLKEERDSLKALHDRFEASKVVKSKLLYDGNGDQQVILEEVREELNYERNLNVDLRLQLQKMQESNAELILALKDLDSLLEQKNQEISNLSHKVEVSEKHETDDDEEQKALEELLKDHRNAKETYLLEQRILDLNSEVEIYRRDKDELEMHIEQLALDYEILKQKHHEMSYKWEQSELQEQLKLQYEWPPLANVNELESKIASLEGELDKHSKGFSDSLATIKELEGQVKLLEEELENQAQEFEANLEVVTHAKVEQEQRAIQAEEALQKMKWKNVNTAEKLQEKFRRLSLQMASSFDANERVAVKALKEAGELRLQKSQVEEMLRKTNMELQTIRDGYEAKVGELNDEIRLKEDKIKDMLLEINEKSKRVEHCDELEKEKQMLKAEIVRLTLENSLLSQKVDDLREQLKIMNETKEEAELAVQVSNGERTELANTVALLKKELVESLLDLKLSRQMKDEQDIVIRDLESRTEMLKKRCNEMKISMLEDEAEKKKLRVQVSNLEGELKKKDDALTSFGKRLNETNKELEGLREKVKMLEGQIKIKESALEDSAVSFLEKEGDYRSKIQELDSRLEELNCDTYPSSKAADGIDGLTSVSAGTDETRSMGAIMCNCNTMRTSRESSSLMNGNGETLSELALLKEKNDLMELELKEMQEKYSDISLKFAEVEGERQKLVMTIRSLKNAKRS